MADLQAYTNAITDGARRAAEMRNALLNPLRRGAGFFAPASKQEADERDALIAASILGTVYESAGQNGLMIAAVHSRALQHFENTHGALPSDDALASMHRTIENAISLTSSTSNAAPGVYEAAEMRQMMSTSEGIMMRDRMISLILPVHLQTITSNFVTYIPGEFNRSEFFRVKRVAASNFGTLRVGDDIGFDYKGLYAVMDQVVELGTGDGAKTTFSFKSLEKFGTKYPFVSHRMKVIYDHTIVGADTGSSALAGNFKAGSQSVVVSGTVDYNEGTCEITFSVAPPAGVQLHIGFDVNIERAPELIPRIDHVMDSRLLFPHESAIAGQASLQALWGLRRELGQDIDNMTMQGLRNLLVADKDRKHLRDMYFYAKGVTEWDRTGSAALTLADNYETLKAALLEVSTGLMRATGTTGLTGLVGDTQAVNVFKYLPSQFFQPASGYREIAQPHYVGRVFGQWDLFCDPWKEEEYSCMCYGKGPDHGQTPYVVGDAVPAMMFNHPRLGDLKSSHTMWELAYRDMQPFDGQKYLTNLKMTKDPA